MKELLQKAIQLCPDATFTLEVTEAEHAMNWLEDNFRNFMHFSH